MPPLSVDERIQRVSDVCCISRDSSRLLLEKHAWNCDSAICGFFDGELETIQSKQKECKKSIETKEPEIPTPPTQIEAEWEKNLPSFLVEAISTESSGSGITVGTSLCLEPECKVRVSRKKAQIVTRNVNESLPARCRLYIQTGTKENKTR